MLQLDMVKILSGVGEHSAVAVGACSLRFSAATPRSVLSWSLPFRVDGFSLPLTQRVMPATSLHISKGHRNATILVTTNCTLPVDYHVHFRGIDKGAFLLAPDTTKRIKISANDPFFYLVQQLPPPSLPPLHLRVTATDGLCSLLLLQPPGDQILDTPAEAAMGTMRLTFTNRADVMLNVCHFHLAFLALWWGWCSVR